MTDIDAQVRDIKTRLATAQRARIRAEHEQDAAKAQADTARAQLRRDFAVATVDEAQATLRHLEDELARTIADLRTALDQTGT